MFAIARLGQLRIQPERYLAQQVGHPARDPITSAHDYLPIASPRLVLDLPGYDLVLLSESGRSSAILYSARLLLPYTMRYRFR